MNQQKNLPFQSLKPTFLIGLGVFLVAFLVRIPGLSWGLPDAMRAGSLHPDEQWNWMVTQRISLGNLDPQFYNYGSLFFLINKSVASVFSTTGDMMSVMRADLLLGRGVSSLFGAGIVWLTFSFLIKRTNILGALFGAGLVCFSPGLVMHSRFYTPDIMSSFFILLALYLVAELEGKSNWHAFAWCGLVAGLATGTKYTGAVVILSAIPALIALKSSARLSATLSLLLATLVGFLASTPGVFLNPQKFAEDFGYEVWHSQSGHGLVFAGTQPAGIFHIGNLVATMGFLGMAIGLAGLARAVSKKHQWAIALVIFAVVYYIILAPAQIKFARYVFPLIPVFCIGFGWMIGRMHEHPNKNWKYGVGLSAFVLAGFFGGGVSDSLTVTMQMVNKDPRDATADYLREVGKGKSVGAVKDPWYWSPTYYPLAQAHRSVPFAVREEARLQSTDPKVLRYIPQNPVERQDWDIRLLTELKPDFLVFSSYEDEGYLRLANQKSDRPEVKQYEEFLALLVKDYDFQRVFGTNREEVHDMKYIRPYLQVWRSKTN